MFNQLTFNNKRNYLLRIGIILSFVLAIFLSSCSEDDESTEDIVRIFEAAFDGNSAGLEAINNTAEVTVLFSTPTLVETSVVLEVAENGVSYGTEYETDPAVSDGSVTIAVPAGAQSASFSVSRLVEFIEDGFNVTFTLASISGEDSPQIVGDGEYVVSFAKVVSLSGTIDLLTGGSTQPNQAYIDLSTGTQIAVARDSWELGFYNGDQNRVFLNSAIKASAAALTGVTDLNSITSTSDLSAPITLYYFASTRDREPTEVVVSTVNELTAGLPVSYSQYGNSQNGSVFTDLATGNLDETAIAEVSTTDSENLVYIVSLGNEVPETAAEPGSINTSGDQRGFMKIRVLTDGNSYTLQYAELDATTFNEVTISKDGSTNLSAFSLVQGEAIDVEPTSWDINFSGVFSFYSSRGFGLTYSDYGLHNTLGGVGLYKLNSDAIPGSFGAPDTPANTDLSFDDFSLSNIDENSFIYDDRTVISSSWRSTSQGIAYDYIYYILKDADGNYYKVQFTALLSENGERGYSQFKYELLQ